MKFTKAKVVAAGVAAETYIRQEPGVNRGDPRYVMGRSSLMECWVNPFRWVNGFEEQDTKSTEWGTLRDCLVLDKSNFDKRFVVRPATYPAPARNPKVKKGLVNEGDPIPWSAKAKECEDWLEENEKGRIVVAPKEMEKNKKADEMMATEPEIEKVLSGAQFQVLIIAEYMDEATGLIIPLKTLHDIVPAKGGAYGDSLADFKTSRTADPEAWPKQIRDYGYHVQGAFYLDIFNAATGEDRMEFRHVVQENVHPFVTELHAMEEDFIKLGRNLYRQALEQYCQCLATKKWPRYRPAIEGICKDGWHYAKPDSRARAKAEIKDPSWLTD